MRGGRKVPLKANVDEALAQHDLRCVRIIHGKGTGALRERVTELLFRRGLSTVAYFDGESMRVVASGLKSAAGIGMSPDGSQVYVSETSGNRIAVFARNCAPGCARRATRAPRWRRTAPRPAGRRSPCRPPRAP